MAGLEPKYQRLNLPIVAATILTSLLFLFRLRLYIEMVSPTCTLTIMFIVPLAGRIQHVAVISNHVGTALMMRNGNNARGTSKRRAHKKFTSLEERSAERDEEYTAQNSKHDN